MTEYILYVLGSAPFQASEVLVFRSTRL